MSRPARCVRRTVGARPKGTRKGHLFTSWIVRSGDLERIWLCSWCGKREKGPHVHTD
jgi:hypothetical protein